MMAQLRHFLVVAMAAAMLAVLFGLRPAAVQAGDTLCVDGSGPGGPNSCWQNSYPTLQAALGVAHAGDEIWVAKGVYTPGLTISDTFTVTSGIALYGGFAATETLRTQRDWVANVTVLSGDIDGNDITDAHGVVTTTGSLRGRNALHVVWLDGITAPVTGTTQVDGFVITGGQADGASDRAELGGGLYCHGAENHHVCSPTIANAIFSGNYANYGGAIYDDGAHAGVSSPILTNVAFRGNEAYIDGAAIYNDGYKGASSPTLTEVVFSGNKAGGTGGAIKNDGRSSGVSSPIFTGVTFSGNYAELSGGAVFNDGRSSGVSSPTLTNVAFISNTAQHGGAIYNDSNTAGTSDPSLINVVFTGNTAAVHGGAMLNESANAGVSRPALTNVTFSGNEAGSIGGAIYNFGPLTGTAAMTLTNVILWGNTAPADPQISSGPAVSLTINYSIVQGGWVTGTNIVDADPRFVDAAGGNLDLRPLSPAIDRGTNTGAPLFDIRDRPRPVNLITDIGAYEAQDVDWVYLPAVRNAR